MVLPAAIVFPFLLALLSTFFSSPSLAMYSNDGMQYVMNYHSERLLRMVNELSENQNAYNDENALKKLFGSTNSWELVRKFAKRSGYYARSAGSRRHQVWVFIWNFFVAIMETKINYRSPKNYWKAMLDLQKVHAALVDHFSRLEKSLFYKKDPLSHTGIKHAGNQMINVQEWGFLSLTPTEVADVSSGSAEESHNNVTEKDVFLKNGIFPEDPQEGGVCVMPPGSSSPSAAKTASNPAAAGEIGGSD